MTVAAAQTLPIDTPQRSVLILIAFAVAALSLMIQGGTLGPLLRVISPKTDEAAAAQSKADRTRPLAVIRETASSMQEPVLADNATGLERSMPAGLIGWP